MFRHTFFILVLTSLLIYMVTINEAKKKGKKKVRYGPKGMSLNYSTTCKQFSKYARFNPYSVLNQKWFVFFYWAIPSSDQIFIFTFPSANHTKFLHMLLDGNVTVPVNWTARQLIMEDTQNITSLLVERSDRGHYWQYMLGRVKDELIDPRDVRLKQTNDGRILGLMDCKTDSVLAMSRINEVPPKNKLHEEAAKLGYRGRRGKSYLYQGHEWMPIPEANEDEFWARDLPELPEENELQSPDLEDPQNTFDNQQSSKESGHAVSNNEPQGPDSAKIRSPSNALHVDPKTSHTKKMPKEPQSSLNEQKKDKQCSDDLKEYQSLEDSTKNQPSNEYQSAQKNNEPNNSRSANIFKQLVTVSKDPLSISTTAQQTEESNNEHKKHQPGKVLEESQPSKDLKNHEPVIVPKNVQSSNDSKIYKSLNDSKQHESTNDDLKLKYMSKNPSNNSPKVTTGTATEAINQQQQIKPDPAKSVPSDLPQEPLEHQTVSEQDHQKPKQAEQDFTTNDDAQNENDALSPTTQDPDWTFLPNETGLSVEVPEITVVDAMAQPV